ncbi:hypothetical protein P7C73_g306, partial [Tremellales sp. Uapishka_1]
MSNQGGTQTVDNASAVASLTGGTGASTVASATGGTGASTEASSTMGCNWSASGILLDYDNPYLLDEILQRRRAASSKGTAKDQSNEPTQNPFEVDARQNAYQMQQYGSRSG